MGLCSPYWTIVKIANLLHVIPTSFSTAVNLPKQSPQTELPWRLNHLPSEPVICTAEEGTWKRAQGNFGLCLFVPGYLSSHKYTHSIRRHISISPSSKCKYLLGRGKQNNVWPELSFSVRLWCCSFIWSPRTTISGIPFVKVRHSKGRMKIQAQFVS